VEIIALSELDPTSFGGNEVIIDFLRLHHLLASHCNCADNTKDGRLSEKVEVKIIPAEVDICTATARSIRWIYIMKKICAYILLDALWGIFVIYFM